MVCVGGVRWWCALVMCAGGFRAGFPEQVLDPRMFGRFDDDVVGQMYVLPATMQYTYIGDT
ncbi:hypothetical protein [Changpingibacter yushuensis]|uniref:hypothetical protein n=1 Tax=Changpingibacter yushuensis TaxID=2758440 RepID=UPI00165E85E3|nr:hypothetical protein [Changpingibacter yushuensis]